MAYDGPQIKSYILVPLNKKVGSVRAGTLCLPKGSMSRAEIYLDEREFSGMLADAIERQGLEGYSSDLHVPKILKVELHNITVRLCAKNWGVFGLGDRESLSGNAQFYFAWQGTESAAEMEHSKVEINLTPHEAMPIKAIAMLAVEKLLKSIAEK